jgi:hypothetical protein
MWAVSCCGAACAALSRIRLSTLASYGRLRIARMSHAASRTGQGVVTGRLGSITLRIVEEFGGAGLIERQFREENFTREGNPAAARELLLLKAVEHFPKRLLGA